MRRRGSPLAVLALAAGVALGAVAAVGGCTSRSGPPAQELRRLIEEAPLELYRPGVAGATPVTFLWRFDTADELGAWTARNFEADRTGPDGGLVVESPSPDPGLGRDVDVDAGSVQTVRVQIEGLERGAVELFWARRGENLDPDRRLVRHASEHVGETGAVMTFEFDVGSDPGWDGRIRRFRLDPTTVAGERVVVHEVRGVRRTPPPDEPVAGRRRAWMVGLAGEYRPALVAGVDRAIPWRLEAASVGSLRFGYGVTCVAGSGLEGEGPFRFEISVGPDGDRLQRAFVDEVPAPSSGPDGGGPGWRDGEVDLSSIAGDPARPVSDGAGGSDGDDRVVVLRVGSPAAPAEPLCVPVWANPRLVVPSSGEPAPGVVLVSVDTLRPDRLSLYGNPRPTSPEIDAWAGRTAVTFASAVAQAPWTLPSHVSMLTGLDALSHPTHHVSGASGRLTLLAEVLQRRGFETVAFTGGGYLDPEYGFTQGFDRYVSWQGEIAAGRELETNMDRLLSWLGEGRGAPFFVFFHTYEPHMPYRAREPWFGRFDGPGTEKVGEAGAVGEPGADGETGVDGETGTGRETGADPRGGGVDPWSLVGRSYLHTELDGGPTGRQSQGFHFDPDGSSGRAGGAGDGEPPTMSPERFEAMVRALYDSGVAYTDAQMGRLFRRLDELGLDSRTFVVLTSDHGEALGEHGLAGHGFLHDDNLLVPLVIGGPGVPGGRVVTDQVRSIDIVPTVLDLLRTDPSPGAVDGVSLAPFVRGGSTEVPPEAYSYAASTNWGISLRVANRAKYLLSDSPWPRLRGHEWLYRLVEDPLEADDVAADRPDEAAVFRELVRARFDGLPGLRIAFANEGEETVRGTLESVAPELGPARIKTMTLGCDCLSWDSVQAVEFTIPPGARYEVLVHDVHDGRFTVRGMVGGPAAGGPTAGDPAGGDGATPGGDAGRGFEARVDAADLTAPRSLVVGPGGASVVDGELEGRTGLTFWWSAGVGLSGGDPARGNERILEQLRALGYIR